MPRSIANTYCSKSCTDFKRREAQRIWQLANKDKLREYIKIYREKNKETYIKTQQDNQEKQRLKRIKDRADLARYRKEYGRYE